MKKISLKMLFLLIFFQVFLFANNTNPSLKELKQKIGSYALVKVGELLNIDTSLFDRKNKFHLYLKVSRNSKIGFKYSF